MSAREYMNFFYYIYKIYVTLAQKKRKRDLCNMEADMHYC